jgi:GNAT superfamily N-acetyltransferase
MSHEWFSPIELPISRRQFRQLPRNPAYRYEYTDGRAWLLPQPELCSAVLDLPTFVGPIARISADEYVVIRNVQEEDWQALPRLFADAFHCVQPFASLAEAERLAAAEICLGRTHRSGEGPLVAAGSLVAAHKSDGTLVGANLITLPPAGDIEYAAGCPHLTWIFVSPVVARRGVAMALLDRAAKELLQLGFSKLASTFLLGNGSSMLWHWRAGFKLLQRPEAAGLPG